jgi:hypothetical protein
MASSIWTISVDGGAYVSLESLGIRNPVVEKASLDVGSLSFSVKVQDIAATAPFSYGQSLVLKRSTVLFFIGRVRYVAAGFSGEEQVWSVKAYDSWWEMERTVYRQPAVFYNSDGTGRVAVLSSMITIRSDAWGIPIPQGVQIFNSMVYASSVSPGIITPGSVPTGNDMPVEETREITVAEAIRRAASVAPSSYAYPEYTSGIWALTWAARGSLGVETIDLDDANLLVSVNGLRRRDDIVPPGVVFDFLQTVSVAGVAQRRLTRQYGGTPSGPLTLFATFNLGPCNTAPSGAAAAYYAALATPHWEGSIQIMEQDPTGTICPGKRVNISNGQAEWASMAAVVQRCTYDLDTGLTSIDVGPPETLGSDDFVDQLNRLRNYPSGSGYCNVQNNGTVGTDDTTSEMPPVPTDDEGAEIPTPTPPSGDEQGVTSPVTGAKPGVSSPTPNPAGGGPSGSGLSAGGIEFLTLCDGSNIAVLTP